MRLASLVLFASVALGTLSAAEPPPGKLVLADTFDRADLGSNWRVTWPNFVIEDGVLKASQAKEHAAVGMVKVGHKDIAIEFRVRFDGATVINCVCNDHDFKEGHGGHISRVSLYPARVYLSDDKERLRHDIEEMRKDPKRKAEADQLVVGRGKTIPAKLVLGQWHLVRIDIQNDEMQVRLDGKALGTLKSSGLAHPVKSDFYFSVAGKDARFDDLKIWTFDTK